SQCTAVGSQREVTFNPASPGTLSPVTVTTDMDTTLAVVECPTTSLCVAVGGVADDTVVPFNPTSPGTPTPVPIADGESVTDLACPSSGQCTAVDESGRAATFN